MNKEYTDITIILDKSGSMDIIKEDIRGGLRTFLEEQKTIPGKCLLTLVEFSNYCEVMFEAKPISEVKSIKFNPTGATALLDTLGNTIVRVGTRLNRLSEDEKPGKVIVAVITDGEENCSKNWTREQVFSSIEHQRTKYSWDFVFLAANQDAIQTGANYGIPASSSYTYVATPKGVNTMYNTFSGSVIRARTTGDAIDLSQTTEKIK